MNEEQLKELIPELKGHGRAPRKCAMCGETFELQDDDPNFCNVCTKCRVVTT